MLAATVNTQQFARRLSALIDGERATVPSQIRRRAHPTRRQVLPDASCMRDKKPVPVHALAALVSALIFMVSLIDVGSSFSMPRPFCRSFNATMPNS